MAKKKKRKKGPRGDRQQAWEKEVQAAIIRRVGTEVTFRKTGKVIYEVSRTVKSTVKNRWAERIQRVRGVKVIGTEDVIDGRKMKQTITFRSFQPSDEQVAKPSKPVVVLRRPPDQEVVQRDPNWYTRATARSKPFVPFYLRYNRPLFEPLDN